MALAAQFNVDPISYSAEVRPAKTAVVELATGVRVTYAELSELADRAGGWIAGALGRSPEGERVAYVGRNGLELLALALGAERCGAIFVPINWRLSGPEIAALLADFTPACVVAQAEFLPLLSHTDARLNVLAEIRQTPPRPREQRDGERPIVLLYTSGTTGGPKGVIITANNAFASSLNFAAVSELGPASVALSDLPMFHTIGLFAITRSTLTVGGTLLLSDRFIPSRSLAVLADPALAVTHYFAVPVMAEALEREPGFSAAAFSRLHAIFLGGAPLPPSLIERFLRVGVPLVNGYGMSEVGTAIHVPVRMEAVRDSAGAIGLPAPHLRVRLVSNGADVAPGEVGEVWLEGPSVTPGYWNRPAETAEAFSDGWYRTGDLARRDANGFYWIVDRLKDMYVSGGENVYPAEVEAVLASQPGVADVAVVGVADARWGETGVAFVVPAGALAAPALLAACSDRLAKYKCPSRIILVDAIPRTAAGKVLKTVLRQRLNSGEFQ